MESLKVKREPFEEKEYYALRIFMHLRSIGYGTHVSPVRVGALAYAYGVRLNNVRSGSVVPLAQLATMLAKAR